MRGYHAFLKQVPTSPPPMPVEGDAASAASHDELVAVGGPPRASDQEPQPQFLSGIAAHPTASDSDA